MTFLNDMRLGGLKTMLSDRIRFQKGLDRLKQWTKFSKIKFNFDTCQVLYLYLQINYLGME